MPYRAKKVRARRRKPESCQEYLRAWRCCCSHHTAGAAAGRVRCLLWGEGERKLDAVSAFWRPAGRALPSRGQRTKGAKMKFRLMLGALVVLVLAAVAATGSRAPPPAKNFTCAGGTWTGDPSTSTFTIIPSGTYSSVTVTGVCAEPGRVINVSGNIDVAPVQSSTRRAGRRQSPSVITSRRARARSSALVVSPRVRSQVRRRAVQ